jgi:hypothetical protein
MKIVQAIRVDSKGVLLISRWTGLSYFIIVAELAKTRAVKNGTKILNLDNNVNLFC